MYSDMTLYALLVGVVVPLLVGVLSKLNASTGVKAALNLGLTILGTALVTMNQIDWDWKAFAINFGVGWAVSVATYYGFYKPTEIAPKLAEATAGFGIG
jgi:hypothetical protein